MIIGYLLELAIIIWLLYVVYTAYAKWDDRRQYKNKCKDIVEEWKGKQ